MQVLVADLDQVGQFHQHRDPFTPPFNVRFRVQAHVRVEADQAFAAFPAHQCQQGVGNRLHHQGKRSDMQAAYFRPECRQVLRLQLSIGAAFATEAVLRRAIGAHGDHRQGGRRGEIQQEVLAHTFILQHLQQTPAQVVGGQPGQQRRIHAQPAQSHGHVERRATGDGFEIHFGRQTTGVVFTEKIEQRFATHQVHSCSLFKGLRHAVDSVHKPADWLVHCRRPAGFHWPGRVSRSARTSPPG
ncbi:hypothetical protein D3C73_612360 [compost metagenome]